MEKIKINLKKISRKEIDFIVEYLKKGKVIIYPTDTIYGLGCLADNAKAIKKIYKIKKRGAKKPLLVLVDSLKMADKYCKIDKEQEKFLKSAWPGPVTVILEHKNKLPKVLTSVKKTLAVRLPKNDFLIKIIKRIKVPLVSTSVNISREKNLVRVDDVDKYFKSPPSPFVKGGKNGRTPHTPPPIRRTSLIGGAKTEMPDLIIDAGKLRGKASVIVDATDVKNIKIIRK